MKKLIVKTALITLAAVIALSFAIYGLFAAISPKSLATFWGDVGSYGLSVKYYEKQYGKTEDIRDLAALCVKVDEVKDSARAEKNLALLVFDGGFNHLCEEEDKNGSVFYSTAYEFYYGKYAVAAFYKSGVNAAILVATKSVEKGYTEHNAFYGLLVGVETLSKEDAAAIKSAVTEIKSGLTGEELVFAERDVSLADSIK